MNLDRVKNRARPSVPFRLLVVGDQALAEAQARLGEAMERKRRADRNLVAEKPDRVKEAKNAAAALKRAEKAFEECWETIRITAMAPDEFEQLKAAHPPTAEQLKADSEAEYNKPAFRAALLAACAEGDLTADEWDNHLNTSFSQGERQEIFTVALGVNAGTRVVESVVLPKGSTPILSLLSNSR
ncbi:MAG UNVERIFIED_CONTAM: hypothetical protein LOD86_10510 [Thermobifida fusca]